MKSITNIKIGTKIALVLGCTIVLLAGLSALSLWAIRSNERRGKNRFAVSPMPGLRKQLPVKVRLYAQYGK